MADTVPSSRTALTPERQALLDRLLQPAEPLEATIPRRPEGAPVPLSYAQQRIWLMEQLVGPSAVHNLVVLWHLRGALDVHALGRAFASIVERHEVLRSRVVVPAGEPLLDVAAAVPVELTVVDLRGVGRDGEAVAEAVGQHFAREPFDLGTAPLTRCTVIRTSPSDHLVQVVVHHVAGDGWSLGVLVAELNGLYAQLTGEGAAAAAVQPVTARFGDVTTWLRDPRREAAAGPGVDAVASWVAGGNRAGLPPDFRRPDRLMIAGARHEVELSPVLVERLEGAARGAGVTLASTILTAFLAVIGRSSGEDDLLVGLAAANRGHPQLEGVIGALLNVVPCRVHLSRREGVVDGLQAVQRSVARAIANQDVPFERVVEALRLPRSMGRAPVVDVLYIFQNAPLPALTLGSTTATRRFPSTGTSKVDLSLIVDRTEEGGLVVGFEYSTDLYRPGTIEDLGVDLLRALHAVADGRRCSIAELGEPPPEVTAAAYAALDRAVPAPGEPAGSIVDLVLAAAEADAAHPALRHGDRTWTAAEVVRRARAVAAALDALGAGRGDRVAVHLTPAPEVLPVLLGIMLQGACYVPLDPSTPVARNRFVLEDADPVVLVEGPPFPAPVGDGVTRVGVEALDGPRRKGPEEVPGPADAAYLMYTSGSTGRPKGVVISHRSLANFCTAMVAERLVRPGEVLAAVTPMSFDISTLELFVPLLAGATVDLVPREVATDGRRFAAFLDERAVDVLQATPSTWRLLLAAGWTGRASLRALCGGEPLTAELADQLVARCHEVWNLYGPTETTVWSTVTPIVAGDVVTVGRPIANTTCYVLDDQGRLQPPGAMGELVIGGDGVAVGYWRRPELTEDRFVVRSLAGGPPARYYRTGDVARLRSDGRLELFGRRDSQVKIRGHRVELGEIESAVEALPGVRSGVVALEESSSGDGRLVAYLVGDGDLDADELRSALARQLPDVMVPGVYRRLAELPLTPNGKVDRAALLHADWQALAVARPRRAQVDDTERAVCAAVAEVLDLPPDAVDPGDDFFHLGGHSLAASRLLHVLRERLGVDLPLRLLFERSELDAIAGWARTAPRDLGPAPVPASDHDLTPAQRRIWVLEQLAPGTAQHAIALRVRLLGDLDLPALGASVDALVERHDGLRSRFTFVAPSPRRTVVPHVAAPLTIVDCSRCGPEGVEEVVRSIARTAIDLDAPPLLRTAVIRRSAREHELVVVVHHIVADRWSLDVLVHELGRCYAAALRGAAADLGPRAIPLGATPVRPEARAWWERSLREAAPLDLPLDHPRSAVRSVRGALRPFAWDAAGAQAIRDIARRHRTTPFGVLLAALDVVLARWCETDDVVVAVPIANRDDPATAGLVDCLVDTVAVRTQLGGDATLGDVLGRARDAFVDAFDNRHVPFDEVVRALDLPRDLAAPPLAQVMLVLHDLRPVTVDLPGLTATVAPVDTGTTKYDLTVMAWEEGGGLAGHVEHASDLFDGTTADRLIAHVGAVIRSMAADPDVPWRVVPLSDVEAVVRNGGEDGPWAWCGDRRTVHDDFARQAAEAPAAVAVVDAGVAVPYAALDARSAQVAADLLDRGVRSGDRVLVAAGGVDAVVAMLGVLRAGATFAVLDPGEPEVRVQALVAELQPAATLVRHGDRPPVGGVVTVPIASAGAAGAGPPTGRVAPCDTAYVVHTSGSTGRPKGMPGSHATLAQFVAWSSATFGIGPGTRIGGWAPLSYDAAYTEIFAALANGGSVHLVDPAVRSDPDAVLTWLRTEGIEQLQTVPSFARALADRLDRHARDDRSVGVPALRHLLLAGEVLDRTLVADLRRLLPGTRVHNLYGPTECILASHHEVGGDDVLRRSVPIGLPIPGRDLLVVDDAGRPTNPGVPGELWIRSALLAGTYLGRPVETASAYPVVAGVPAGHLYRTGDRARLLHDGRLEFLGRTDGQVKLRGRRIELDEVQHHLVACDGVADAAVAVRPAPEHPALVGYVVLAPGASLGAVRAELTTRLPAWMVPSILTEIDAVPRTSSNKRDRRALPDPVVVPPPRRSSPPTPLESLVAGAWCEVLGRDEVPLDVPFFEVGGDSLLAAAVQVALADRLDRPVALVDLFTYPTVASFAAQLDGSEDRLGASATAGQVRGRERRIVRRGGRSA